MRVESKHPLWAVYIRTEPDSYGIRSKCMGIFSEEVEAELRAMDLREFVRYAVHRSGASGRKKGE